MKYVNLKNGNVIDVSSSISGDDWQAVEPANSDKKSKVAPVQHKKGTGKGKNSTKAEPEGEDEGEDEEE